MEFELSLEILKKFSSGKIARAILPVGFRLNKREGTLFEVFDKSARGENARAGYIFFNDTGIKLTTQANEAGLNLKNAWFGMFPVLNPSRMVWVLFVPGVYERRLMGFIPEGKIGLCESRETLDQRMGDTQYPCGTIAALVQADLVWAGDRISCREWCEVCQSGGLEDPKKEAAEKEIRLTNPRDWEKY